ncbi:AHH domain-containing protein [Myxococcus sp. CA051A]|uniref:AHH domain-containing protein n=1 Tax=unclassified Myxococcus TaxID=2648731 RepID=UPI00157B1599|nr:MULTISPECIES: AHH domain-containing protein [unclassified Myxococcus]NTX06629.1 AHH domain-containing protein [Myxococcus sp. CA040A]NTX53276.1 AHH domain-containing protein [Myxococcus sp. CA039A]NTX67280.1 AHH domain-containing protein [Myxococcus sp. CA051A]
MSLVKHIAKTRKREIVTQRVSGFQKNCNTGFERPGFWEAHHIVCVSSVGKRRGDYPKSPPDLADYIEACLWVTPWDINAAHNLIGLPLNRQYRDSDGESPVDLPSHQVDHNTRDGFTDEVSKYLKENVWCSLTAKKKVHDVDIAKLKEELRSASIEFRGRLESRGTRKGGTKLCWRSRHDEGFARKWYYPFSMGKTPSHRSPGVAYSLLDSIFKKIKLPF